MKQISYADINKLNPCYSPGDYIPETWSGTSVDILKMTNVQARDRLWVVVRAEFLNDNVLCRYALACARQCEKFSDSPDVKYCNDITEAFIGGWASKEELIAAQSTVWNAAGAAARSASASAAWSASAASAIVAAARSAQSTVWNAAWSASGAAGYAAGAAARSAEAAAQEEQCIILIDLIERYS
jgi:hypothetical protein